MKASDGRGYTFRKLEKHPERVLPKEWQDSELRAVAIDQTSAAHPASTVIVGSLAQSVGIPFYGSRLVVMPDDPALGEFRTTFGGSGRHLRRVPRARHAEHHRGHLDVRPLEEVEGGRAEQQGRRSCLPQGAPVRPRGRQLGPPPGAVALGAPRRRRALWVPLPEDADQAFTRYEGKAMGVVRRVVPRFMRYSGEYPKRIEGLTTNNYDVTRWLLTRVEWPVFEEVARELAAQMTRRRHRRRHAPDAGRVVRDRRGADDEGPAAAPRRARGLRPEVLRAPRGPGRRARHRPGRPRRPCGTSTTARCA